MDTKVFFALSTLQSPEQTAKDLVMCDENSTEIPTAITRLTRDTAFKVICHLLKCLVINLVSEKHDLPYQYIIPPRLTRIMMMTTKLMTEDTKSSPIMKKVTTKMADNEIPNDLRVSCHMVKYCS